MEAKAVKHISMANQVFEDLKREIISGGYQPGEKLPSETRLCEIYEVSRTTIRHALSSLQSLALIESRAGDGSFVAEPNAVAVLRPAIARSFLSDQSLMELIEFRQLIEPNVTRIACARASDEDIQKLANIYKAMQASRQDTLKFSELDYNFHIEIARISRNAYVKIMYETVKDILLSAFANITMYRGNFAGLKYHRLILNAFENRDQEMAAQFMQEHMNDMANAYQKLEP